MEKTVEHLKSLTGACRAFWTQDNQKDYFETEMVRAEDHLAELEEKSWDYEIFVIAVAPEANKIRSGQLYYDIGHALRACNEINEYCETPGHWKVYRGIINFDKEAVKKMPIYEYKCESCGREKEILHKRIPKRNWVGCDKCKGVMKHVLSSTSDPVVHGFSEKNNYSHTKDVKKDNKEKT